MTLGLALLLFWFQARSPVDAARALIADGRMREAVEALAKLESTPATDYLLGLAYYNLGRHKEAAVALTRAVRAVPADSPIGRDAPRMLGQSLYVTGNLKDALPWLGRAHRVAPGNIEISYMLGTCYLLGNQPEKAVAAFGRMFAVPPDSAAAYLLTGQMAIRRELNAVARQLLRRALALDPRIPEAHYLLALAAIFDGDVDTGIAELKQEIAVNPNFAMAHYRLGEAYTRQDDWDRAIPSLQRAVWLNPNYSGPFILLGKGYFQTQQYANAEGMLRKAIEMDPQNYSAHYLLGQTLLKSGLAAEGRQMLKRSIEIRRQLEAAPLEAGHDR